MCGASIKESRRKLANTQTQQEIRGNATENFCLSVILFAFPVVDRRTADPSASLGMTNRKEPQLIERGLQTEAFGRVNFDRSAEA